MQACPVTTSKRHLVGCDATNSTCRNLAVLSSQATSTTPALTGPSSRTAEARMAMLMARLGILSLGDGAGGVRATQDCNFKIRAIAEM